MPKCSFQSVHFIALNIILDLTCESCKWDHITVAFTESIIHPMNRLFPSWSWDWPQATVACPHLLVLCLCVPLECCCWAKILDELHPNSICINACDELRQRHHWVFQFVTEHATEWGPTVRPGYMSGRIKTIYSMCSPSKCSDIKTLLSSQCS